MEEELPYKLLTLSHGLQCVHQLSLPLLTVHYTKYSIHYMTFKDKKVVNNFETTTCKIDDVFCRIQ